MKSFFEIRKASAKDMQAIQELNLLLFKKEYKEYDRSLNLKWTFGKHGRNFFKRKISKGCLFVAVANNKIVGYLAGGLIKAEPARDIKKLAELENMFVLDKYRSMGIGSALCKEFLRWCKLKKVTLARVAATYKNRRAIEFYKRNGFNNRTITLEADV